MPDEGKWYLPSGMCVENILYEYFKNIAQECAVHSWIINTQDSDVEGRFGAADWEIICNSLPPLPDPDEKMLRSLEPFMGVSINPLYAC